MTKLAGHTKKQTTPKAESATAEVRAQHTPGPWLLNVHDDIEMGEEGPIFSIADVSPNGASYEEGKANGRLIAAAPELLTALRHLLAVVDSSHPDHESAMIDEAESAANEERNPSWESAKTAAFVSASAAIAKAEGQT